MIIKNSQQDFVLDLPTNIKYIGVRMSGGTDSSILGYMLATYIVKERPDLILVPITINHLQKAFSIDFVKRIIQFIKTDVGDVFGDHQTIWASGPTDKENEDTLKQFTKDLGSTGKIDCVFSGITQNPPLDVLHQIMVDYSIDSGPPNRDGYGKLLPNETAMEAGTRSINRYMPFKNVNKRGIAEFYNTMGVMDTLFPLTRSCDADTTDFSKHCNNEYFCAERLWGFGKLD